MLNHDKFLMFIFLSWLTQTQGLISLVIFLEHLSLYFFRKYEELAKIAEETKKNFAAYERDDLQLREVGSSLNPFCLSGNFASLLGLCSNVAETCPSRQMHCSVVGVHVVVILNL